MRMAQSIDASDMLYPNSREFLKYPNRCNYNPAANEARMDVLGTDKATDFYRLLKSVDVTSANSISQWFDTFYKPYKDKGVQAYAFVIGRYIVGSSNTSMQSLVSNNRNFVSFALRPKKLNIRTDAQY